ncbi:hypothetical protein SANTM175S_01917 [Streptomyces antimycoticus]
MTQLTTEDIDRTLLQYLASHSTDTESRPVTRTCSRPAASTRCSPSS